MSLLRKFVFLILILPLMAGVATAGVPSFFDQPDTGYVSNTVIDMVSHNGAIWLATDEGLNFSDDGGQTWYLYDKDNGLVSSSISAFFSIPISGGGERLWVATNHQEEIAGVLTGISDGVSYTDDDGLTWHQIDFETAPNDIPYVWGGDRTIYDIAGHYDPTNESFDNWLFFSAFAGGLLGSKDGGMSWRRIFPTSADSIQFYTTGVEPSLRNRYFSVAVDTSHVDSVFVWGGTAAGLFQYIFAEPKDKPYTKFVTAIEMSKDTNFIYYGGKKGMSRGTKKGGPFVTKFMSDGLPGNEITAILEYGGKLFVGTSTDSVSTGLAISDDYGDSFTAQTGLTEVVGENRLVNEFTLMNDRLYLAGGEAGLLVSTDTGLTWSTIMVDSSDMTSANRRNFVYSLEALGDTLNVGTDSGLVRLYMDGVGNFTAGSSLFYVFGENASSSTSIRKIRTLTYDGANTIWTINHPIDNNFIATAVVSRSDDGGNSFISYDLNDYPYDITFVLDAVYIVGNMGVRRTLGTLPPTDSSYAIREYVSEELAVDSLHKEDLTIMKVIGLDTILIGSQVGFAISTDTGRTYNIFRVNQDSLSADANLHNSSELLGLTGDWFPALGIQYRLPDDDREKFARVWASNRPTYGGTNSISVGHSITIITSTDTTIQRLWQSVYDGYAWNYAFNGDTVFAATNEGLLYALGDSLVYGLESVDNYWNKVELQDEDGYPLVFEGTPIYAVEVNDGYLWVGNDDRTIRVNLNDFTQQTAFYVLDTDTPADEVYAFPVPYSHVQNMAVEFHFTVEKDANVTLEIYDFAMNKVTTVINNQFYEAGVYPTAGKYRQVWNGLNDKGDEVAIGMYYFKVEYSTGEVRWGKLAVIP